jgi:hypothetical protein
MTLADLPTVIARTTLTDTPHFHVKAMTYKWTGEKAPPEFDQELASTYVGKYILVGVTYFDHFGKEIEKIQMHGVVRSASPKGIEIALEGVRKGESWVMPPTLDSISLANPGTYKLHATGETIEDPDLLSTWSVTKPCQN